MTEDDLIAAAVRVLRPYRTKNGRLFGDVGAAILSEKGKLYTGISVDTPNWGLYAERSAMAAMITNGEYKIQKVVAAWRDERNGKLYVLPPSGICREFLRNVDEDNLNAQVVLGRQETVRFKSFSHFMNGLVPWTIDFSRSTRFEPENRDAASTGCHRSLEAKQRRIRIKRTVVYGFTP
ncbi:MAG TPA: cytidine deaminase [Chthoniobacterales bacterium]|jgi:cytidine deaminase|nr:cytidine deaminase [Chthoniobacterales bacterium]